MAQDACTLETKVCNFDLYRPVLAVHTGLPGYRYVDRPLPVTWRLRSISAVGGGLKKKSTVDGRLREKSIVDGRLREKSIVGSRLRKKKGRRRGKGKKKKEGKKEYLARASSSPACGRGSGCFFSRLRRWSVSPFPSCNSPGHVRLLNCDQATRPVCARPPASQSLRHIVELVRMSGDSGDGLGVLMLEWRSPGEEGVVLLGSAAGSCKEVGSGRFPT
ncbi:hypothetical protein BHM03_00048961 [Ensete ventricosum]|nr:hypothetical protein BHM03_00048961 [Ensete ventricosum]